MVATETSIRLLGAALFVAPIVWFRYQQSRPRKTKSRSEGQRLQQHVGAHIKPPFPPIIVELLSKCRLAYMSTIDMEESSSHLSLMSFTFLPEEQVIVLSTQRKTKKYLMLQKQRGVSLLVHDFATAVDGGVAEQYAITLNGTCQIEEGETAELYRAAHLKHNPNYPQFIVGEDIAILAVYITTARICNILDQVVHWNVHDGSSGSLDGSSSSM
jgi:hypothetical protein